MALNVFFIVITQMTSMNNEYHQEGVQSHFK